MNVEVSKQWTFFFNFLYVLPLILVFFNGIIDGLVLSKLINDAVPDTIDERVLNKASKNKNKPINAFQMTGTFISPYLLQHPC